MIIRSNTVARVALGLCVLLASSAAFAQQATLVRPAVTAKVDVVLSRFDGEKKVSSLPFTLWLNVPGIESNRPFGSDASASIRMGVDVPIAVTTSSSTRLQNQGTSGSTSTTGATTKPEYRSVGTQIDCSAQQLLNLPDGYTNVNVRVDDSSIYAPGPAGRGIPRVADPMAFRTFSFSNRLPMRDGQTLQFAVGTDKISGETLRVDVTFTVVK